MLDVDQSHLGVLYFDYFPRDGKSQGAWCGNYVEQTYEDGKRVAPVVSVVCNFTRPAGGNPALLTLDEYSSDFNARPGSALDRALAAAVTAVRLAPASARAHQVMMDALFLRGAIEDALKSGQEALARNPYDPDVLASVGARYVQLNRPAEGLPLLERAVALSNGRPRWYDFYLYLAAYLTGATKLADAHAALINAEETPLGLIGRAMAAAASGDSFALDHALQTLRQKVPLFDLDARLYLARRGFSTEVAERILAVINSGGLRPR